MKYHMKQSIRIILLFSFFTISSCENVIDCIINVRPVLSDKRLAIGGVNQFYSEIISAEIKNEPRDNAYEYYYDIRGDIPEGLGVTIDYRDIFIEGTPTKAGRYTFTVHLDVDPPNGYYYDEDGNERYDDSLCSDSTSRTYTIAIK
ncbi:hypothetical protein [Wocania ichthyoenteri]|uniref:hypothetical protein n=1 Tax=Wocania ichthyoenteri TaxID=1230531 RepID=UPI0012E064E9|nr:hypothetical protein [Wocania ichthyoenteri]